MSFCTETVQEELSADALFRQESDVGAMTAAELHAYCLPVAVARRKAHPPALLYHILLHEHDP